MSDTSLDFVDSLIDRRTVIIVIFSMILAHSLWGLAIPIDSSNVLQSFIDIIILAGYIYLARTIYRLPVALVFSFIISMHQELSPKTPEEKLRAGIESGRRLSRYIHNEPPDPFKVRFREFVSGIFCYIKATPRGIIKTPIILFGFGRLTTEIFRGRYFFYYVVVFFAILDRAGLVGISVFATIPNFQSIIHNLGIAGIILMVGLFIFTGGFTALIQDPIEKQELKEKQASQTVESYTVHNSETSPLYVKVVNTVDVREMFRGL